MDFFTELFLSQLGTAVSLKHSDKVVISGVEDSSAKLLSELGLRLELDQEVVFQHSNLNLCYQQGLDLQNQEFELDSIKSDSRPLGLCLTEVCQ